MELMLCSDPEFEGSNHHCASTMDYSEPSRLSSWNFCGCRGEEKIADPASEGGFIPLRKVDIHEFLPSLNYGKCLLPHPRGQIAEDWEESRKSRTRLACFGRHASQMLALRLEATVSALGKQERRDVPKVSNHTYHFLLRRYRLNLCQSAVPLDASMSSLQAILACR